MWHTLKFVAESSNLGLASLTDFALAHEAKYGIVQDRGEPEVNTWHVDQLVKDYKTLNDDLLRFAVNRGH